MGFSLTKKFNQARTTENDQKYRDLRDKDNIKKLNHQSVTIPKDFGQELYGNSARYAEWVKACKDFASTLPTDEQLKYAELQHARVCARQAYMSNKNENHIKILCRDWEHANENLTSFHKTHNFPDTAQFSNHTEDNTQENYSRFTRSN